MTDRKTAIGCIMFLGFFLMTVALAVSVANVHGIGWGVAAFLAANGAFWFAVGVSAAKKDAAALGKDFLYDGHGPRGENLVMGVGDEVAELQDVGVQDAPIGTEDDSELMGR